MARVQKFTRDVNSYEIRPYRFKYKPGIIKEGIERGCICQGELFSHRYAVANCYGQCLTEALFRAEAAERKGTALTVKIKAVRVMSCRALYL